MDFNKSSPRQMLSIAFKARLKSCLQPLVSTTSEWCCVVPSAIPKYLENKKNNIHFKVWLLFLTSNNSSTRSPPYKHRCMCWLLYVLTVRIKWLDTLCSPLRPYSSVLALLMCPSLQRGIGLNATGMAVLEVNLPSGFGLATPPDDLTTHHHHDYQQAALKKVETPPGKVILYLDYVSSAVTPLSSALPLGDPTAKWQWLCVASGEPGGGVSGCPAGPGGQGGPGPGGQRCALRLLRTTWERQNCSVSLALGGKWRPRQSLERLNPAQWTWRNEINTISETSCVSAFFLFQYSFHFN